MMLLQVGVVSDYDLLALDSISGTIGLTKPLYFLVFSQVRHNSDVIDQPVLGDLVTFS